MDKNRHNNKLDESLMRDSTKKQMMNLKKTIDASGGDIESKVRKGSKTKESRIPNTMYMDNPFGSNRQIDTWEHFSKNDANNKSIAAKSTEPKGKPSGKMRKFEQFKNEITNESKTEQSQPIENWIQELDTDVRGSMEDKLRPMYVNRPNRETRPSYDILRSGKYINIDGQDCLIIGLKNNKLLIDSINKNTQKHEIIELPIKDALKHMNKKEKNSEKTVINNPFIKPKK